jgi:hypothetical protein
MRNLLLFTGAAALALAAPAAAEKGGHGGGKGGGGGQAAHVQHGGGGAKHAPGGGKGHVAQAAKPQKAERQAFRPAKPHKAERQAFRADKHEAKRQDRVVRERFDDRRGFDGGGFRDEGRRLAGFDQSCPPGLARKSPACVPPGQAKKLGLGDRIGSDWFRERRIPAWYSGFYPETEDYYYRYDDEGYIYRIDREGDLVSSIIPLLGGGFAVGQPLPSGYDIYNVPLQYRDAYYDSDDSLYRYGDNAIYRVDPESGLIESVVALLTGDVLVGQKLPSGYDAYNLPMAYRDEYYDSDDSLYRYADGNIYQVDAKTQIVQAIVEMLL